MLVRSACYLCGTTEAEAVISSGEWQVLRCPKCELGWLDPKPDTLSLSALYDDRYFTNHRIMIAETDEELAIKTAAQSSRVKFIRRHKNKGTLLDIGCASGHFLACARKFGFEVCGLEVSEWAVRQGREVLGLDIEQGTIESTNLGRERFDIITLWHVAEHIEDPIKSFDKLREYLKYDGLLVFECPNSGSFDARRYGVEWAGWRIPYHLWHFTPRSLDMLLRRSGYEVIHVQTTRSQWIKDRLKKIPALALTRNLISSCFSGRDMRVVARPIAGHTKK